MIRRAFLALALAAPASTASAQDMFTLKPIVKAVREGDEEKVRQALLKGENPNQSDILKAGAAADATDREGYTSLLRAAERGDVDMVEILLRKNAKPGVQNRQGVTPLIVASRLGFAEVVKALLDKKADPNTADFTGRTALSYARQSGRPTIEAMLRRAGGRE